MRGRPVATGTAVHAAAVALRGRCATTCSGCCRGSTRCTRRPSTSASRATASSTSCTRRRRPRPPRDGRAAAAAAPKSPRAVEPSSRSWARCLATTSAARRAARRHAQHCTKVPFKSVLMHVCVLDASDGVVDGDNEVRPARNSAQLGAIRRSRLTPRPPLSPGDRGDQLGPRSRRQEPGVLGRAVRGGRARAAERVDGAAPPALGVPGRPP